MGIACLPKATFWSISLRIASYQFSNESRNHQEGKDWIVYCVVKETEMEEGGPDRDVVRLHVINAVPRPGWYPNGIARLCHGPVARNSNAAARAPFGLR